MLIEEEYRFDVIYAPIIHTIAPKNLEPHDEYEWKHIKLFYWVTSVAQPRE